MNSNPTGYPTTMQQHANPMLAAAAGYPIQSGSPGNQQFPFYANPMAAYPPQVPQARPGAMQQQQQQQQHSFNPMQIQTSGPGGPMMPSNMVAPQTNLPYSSPSPYHPTSIPTTTTASPSHSQSPTTAATISMQMPSQNMAAVANPAMLAAQQQQQQQQRPAPPANQPPQGQQQPQQQQQQQQQQQAVPQSPAAAARERARVSTLLEINSTLLQELLNMQAAGKSGGPPQAPTNQEQQTSSPNSTAESNAAGEAPRKPSQEYVECLKRLQTNLVYLASVTDRTKKPGPSAPPILTPPPHMSSLTEIYSKLSELFPAVPRPAAAHQQRPSQSGIATTENAV
ncbi:hypothetical protein UA08_03327 [Talaromyces atroroseus]|uniref:Uncharacterized protein n=1 Tax=Talaromyces atroroseus TaxID=1441469 RepID=A0A225B1K4_TALAT|nr:hypothetical protein UA08_03327 [Talaromyces atroroseus]OKL61106.1 hypothetical protein UA08_03327 [Talaromyces atroroseus]